jgi:hypothetical protein
MTLTVKDDNGKVVAEFVFMAEKISSTGKPNRYAGGKVEFNGNLYQLGCNMTQIVKK